MDCSKVIYVGNLFLSNLVPYHKIQIQICIIYFIELDIIFFEIIFDFLYV